MIYRLSICVLGAVLTVLSACSNPPLHDIVINNVSVIDADGGLRLAQTIAIDGGRITKVVPATTGVDASTVIEGSGKFLIPGLWDFHVHLSYDDALSESMPALFLSYGITSVRDTGGPMRKLLPLLEKLRDEQTPSPRIFFAGPLLDGSAVVYDGIGRPEIGIQNANVDQAVDSIKTLKQQGVDFIKIYEMVSPTVFNAMVETARELNLPIDSHVPLSMRASVAGAQVDSMEHLRNIELDCTADASKLLAERKQLLENSDKLSGATLRAAIHKLQRLPAVENYSQTHCDQTLLALKKTVQVPTLRLNALGLHPPHLREDWNDALSKLPNKVQNRWRAMLDIEAWVRDTRFGEWSLFLTTRMHQLNLPIAAGTDTPIGIAVPGYSLHSELEMLVRAGLTPLEAIATATIEPSKYFSLEDQLGTIGIGKQADLVLLNANPLENIANTKTVAAVFSRGKYFDSKKLSTLLNSVKSAGN